MDVDGNKLTPSEGYKYITDGTTYSDLVFLGKNASADSWHDTNDEPPEPSQEEEPMTPEEIMERLEAML